MAKRKKSKRDRMDSKIVIDSIDLRIVYDLSGEKLQFEKSTISESTFDLSILDKDQDKSTGETKISFNNIKELRDIIANFEEKYNNLNKRNGNIKS